MNSNDQQDRTKPGQVDWLAFQYIADELDQQQREQFEMRLADDQLVRNAVEQAMQQAQLIYAGLKSEHNEHSLPLPKSRALASASPKSVEYSHSSRNSSDSSVRESRTRLKGRSAQPRTMVWYATIATLLLVAIGGFAFFNNLTSNRPDAELAEVSGVPSTPLATSPAADLEMKLATAWLETLEDEDATTTLPREFDSETDYTDVVFSEYDRDWILAATNEIASEGLGEEPLSDHPGTESPQPMYQRDREESDDADSTNLNSF